MGQLISIFINVVTPVFAVVLIGYLVGPRLNLEARTLSKASYYIFMPSFVFHIMSQARIQAGLAVRMTAYMLAVCFACAVMGFVVAKSLGRSAEITAVYVLVAAYSNSGNFGLSLIKFRFGEAALVPATIYLLVLILTGFVIGVAAASWARGGALSAIWSVFKTPSLIAFVPAALFRALDVAVPLFLSRIMGLLADAMIPVMLVTLGVQLASVGVPRINLDMIVASMVRLLGGPLLAALLVIPFGLTGLERSTGILQASMPAAVLTSLIAIEYDLAPALVTTTVLLSTLISLVTVTVVLSLV